MKRAGAPLLDRIAAARASWQKAGEDFKAGGGNCIYCFDTGRYGAGTCEHCDKGRALAEANRCREADLYVAQAHIDPFDGRTVANWPGDPTTKAAVLRWFRGGERPGLLLTGPTGTGKSSLAAALLRERIRRTVKPGLRLTEGEFFALLKPSPEQDAGLRFTAARTPALVIDDLGTEKETQFTEGERFGLINARYEHARWTVITTNLPFEADTFVRAIGERVHDRLREMCQVVEVRGESLRHGQEAR